MLYKTHKIAVIGNAAINEVFEKVANEFPREIEMCVRVDDFEDKTDDQIIAYVDRIAGLEWIVLHPSISTPPHHRAKIMFGIKSKIPSIKILAHATDASLGPLCLECGADAFLSHSQFSVPRVVSILTGEHSQATVSKPKIVFADLEFTGRYFFRLSGQADGGGPPVTRQIVLGHGPMKLSYFLGVARAHNRSDFMTYGRPDYLCNQPALWDALEDALWRKPRRGTGMDRSSVEILSSLADLIDKPRTPIGKEGVPVKIGINELSPPMSTVNDRVKEAFHDYQTDPFPLIQGPGIREKGKVRILRYTLTESIKPECVTFNTSHDLVGDAAEA